MWRPKKWTDDQRIAARYREEITSPALAEIGHIFDRYLADIHNSADMLTKFYVEVRPRRYKEGFTQAVLMRTSPIELSQYEQHASEAISPTEFLERSFDPDARVFLISPIGRGKSTFLNHLTNVQLAQSRVFANTLRVFIDVKGVVSKIEDLHNVIAEQAASALRDAVREIDFTRMTASEWKHVQVQTYLLELKEAGLLDDAGEIMSGMDQEVNKRLAEWFGSKGMDRITMVKKLSVYARGLTRRELYPILIVDNIDHLVPFFQAQAILDVTAIANRLGWPLILAMRDSTARTNIEENPLRISHPNAFCLDAPMFAQIARTRLEALRLTLNEVRSKRGGSTTAIETGAAGEWWSTERLLDVCLAALNILLEERRPVLHMLEALSNASVREFLRLVRLVLSSVHTFGRFYTWSPTPKMTDYVKERQILAAAILGTGAYYSRYNAETNIVNLFELGVAARHLNHFLAARVLQYFNDFATEGVTADNLVQLVQSLYEVERNVVDGVLLLFWEKGLIVRYNDYYDDHRVAASAQQYREEILRDRLFITLCGKYHVEELLYDMTYIEEMRFETRIFDASAYARIFPSSFDGSLNDILASGEEFVRYLSREEDRELTELRDRRGFDRFFSSITTEMTRQYCTKADEIRKWR